MPEDKQWKEESVGGRGFKGQTWGGRGQRLLGKVGGQRWRRSGGGGPGSRGHRYLRENRQGGEAARGPGRRASDRVRQQ